MAVAYAVAHDDVGVALAIVRRLWSHVYSTARLIEAEDWAAAALAIPGAADAPDARWAYVLLSVCAFLRAQLAAMEGHARAAVAVEKRLGLQADSRVELMLSNALGLQARSQEAHASAQRAARLAARQGRLPDQVEALYDQVQWTIHDDRDADPQIVTEIIQVAEASKSRAATAIATFTAGIAATRTDPKRAVELLRRGETPGRRRRRAHNHRSGSRRARAGVGEPGRTDARVAGPDQHARQPAGAPPAVRHARVLRDFLRAFSQLGRFETVAMLDGAAAAIAWTPAWARQAVAEASAALGDDAYNTARERGRSLTDDAVEKLLRSELEQVRSACP